MFKDLIQITFCFSNELRYKQQSQKTAICYLLAMLALMFWIFHNEHIKKYKDPVFQLNLENICF